MSDLRGALKRIYQQNGELTPQHVVDDARPEGSELHSRFEWNDTVAGEAYRRVQAAELIRSVRIQFSNEGTGERKFVRAFSSVRQAGDAERGGYAPTDELMRDEFATKLMLRECKREIADLRKKYEHLEEFSALVRAEFGELAS